MATAFVAQLGDCGYDGLAGYAACRAVSGMGHTHDAALPGGAFDLSVDVLAAINAPPPATKGEGRSAAELNLLHEKKERLEVLLREMYTLRSTDKLHLRQAKRQLRAHLEEITILESELAEQTGRLTAANSAIDKLAAEAVHLKLLLSEVIACSRILTNELRQTEGVAGASGAPLGARPASRRQGGAKAKAKAKAAEAPPSEAPTLLELLESGCARVPKQAKAKAAEARSRAKSMQAYLDSNPCVPYTPMKPEEEEGTEEGTHESPHERLRLGCAREPRGQRAEEGEAEGGDGEAPPVLEALFPSSGELWARLETTAELLSGWSVLNEDLNEDLDEELNEEGAEDGAQLGHGDSEEEEDDDESDESDVAIV